MPTEAAVVPPALSIRLARDEAPRARAFALRARADGSASAAGGDAWDDLPNAVLLIAQSGADGEILGSLRILAGDRGPLMVDGLLGLPASLQHRSIGEGSRLAVREGRDARHVRNMLWKAFHRYCLAAQLQTMLVAVRDPAAPEYEALGFTDALPGGERFAPRGRSQPTHRLLRLGVFDAYESMLRNRHPLREFFFVERHPEIDLLDPARPPVPARPARLPDRLRVAGTLAELAVV